MHDIHLGTLNPVLSSGESSEAVPVDCPEAGFLESVAAPEEYILEAVFDPSDVTQGKPRSITYFTFESFNSCVMPVH